MSQIAKKLALDEVDIEDNVFLLTDVLKRDLNAIPKKNSRTIRRVKRWLEQLEYISTALKGISDNLKPRLEMELDCIFPDSELLHIVMFQPSTRNLFMELRIYFQNNETLPIQIEDFENLEAISDMGSVIAMLGDAAISIAILHHLWRNRTSDAGEITQKRANLVSNENMARLCDRWGLYKARIHFDPPTKTKSEMEHIKGTLLEAIYGIIYINEGFEKIIKTVQLLK